MKRYKSTEEDCKHEKKGERITPVTHKKNGVMLGSQGQCGKGPFEEPSGATYEPSCAAALSFLRSMRARDTFQEKVSDPFEQFPFSSSRSCGRMRTAQH